MTAPVDFLVTGAGGQLGSALLERARLEGTSAVGATRGEMDVQDAAGVRRWVLAHRPRFVLHCAALTDVDACELDPPRAWQVNVEGSRNVAQACREAGAGILHVSTDFVFDGARRVPYTETDVPSPLSVYGSTKLASEEAVSAVGVEDAWIVRTQWVFARGGRNFPSTVLRRARAGEVLRVVDDQTGSPTYAPDLAEALLALLRAGRGGLYHAANSGSCTRFDLARLVLDLCGPPKAEVEPIASDRLDRPARRPAYSVLDTSLLAQTIGRPLPDWRDAVRRWCAAAGASRVAP